MLYCVICDDQPEQRAYLEQRLDMLEESIGKTEIALSTDDTRAVIAYAEQSKRDTLYFIDLKLDDASVPAGLELCQDIWQRDSRAYIVFVSSHPQYALQCCRSHAFDFLVKPYTLPALRGCIEAVQLDISRKAEGLTLTVEAGSRVLNLDQRTLMYFSRDGVMLTAHTENDTVSWRETFLSLMDRISMSLFIHAHKGYIVNKLYIREMLYAEKQLVLTNGEVIPYSRRKEDEVIEALRSRGEEAEN